MDLDRPHSGGSNNSVHFIRSLADLKAIVTRETHPEVDISIFRAKQYPIRGIANESLLTDALEQIPDKRDFRILSVDADPIAPCSAIGFGGCHQELREEFSRLAGQQVRVGTDPFDLPPFDHLVRFFNDPDQVLVVRFHILRFYRNPESRAFKNRVSYAPFDAAPEQYIPHIGFW
jgi:hypothetical protein